VNLSEWVEELDYSLANGPGTPALLTLASCSGDLAQTEVIDAARQSVEKAGWTMYLRAAEQPLEAMSELQDSGFLVLYDVGVPLPVRIPILVGAFQHLVREGMQVGLLVTGTPAGIRQLRLHPAMGFLSRAESVKHTR
jgi:hypothetical protein